MKLFSKLMVVIALGVGFTAAAAESSVGRASITGVTPYGGYQPYVLNIFLSNGKAPSSDAIRSDGKDGEIGFHSFSVTPDEYKIIYKCDSNHEPTFQGEVAVTFRAGQRYVLTCTSAPARLRVEVWSGAVPNISFKPNPLRGSA